MSGRRNIAARAGRWSAAHRKTAIFGWLAFVLVAFGLGGSLGTRDLGPYEGGAGESGGSVKVLGKEFRQPTGERVLVQAKEGGTGASQLAAGVRDVRGRLAQSPDVTNVRRPVQSKDGRSVLVEFQVKGDL